MYIYIYVYIYRDSNCATSYSASPLTIHIITACWYISPALKNTAFAIARISLLVCVNFSWPPVQ